MYKKYRGLLMVLENLSNINTEKLNFGIREVISNLNTFEIQTELMEYRNLNKVIFKNYFTLLLYFKEKISSHVYDLQDFFYETNIFPALDSYHYFMTLSEKSFSEDLNNLHFSIDLTKFPKLLYLSSKINFDIHKNLLALPYFLKEYSHPALLATVNRMSRDEFNFQFEDFHEMHRTSFDMPKFSLYLKIESDYIFKVRYINLFNYLWYAKHEVGENAKNQIYAYSLRQLGEEIIDLTINEFNKNEGKIYDNFSMDYSN
jgi:hypothetical protein